MFGTAFGLVDSERESAAAMQVEPAGAPLEDLCRVRQWVSTVDTCSPIAGTSPLSDWAQPRVVDGPADYTLQVNTT